MMVRKKQSDGPGETRVRSGLKVQKSANAIVVSLLPVCSTMYCVPS